MDCIHPLYIRNGAGITVAPCGRCPACLTRKRNSWGFRIQQEALNSRSSFFFTLTYNEEHVPLGEIQGMPIPCVDKRDVQLFVKRFRKNLEVAGKVRYFIVSEYGPTTLRPHYHGIFFFPDLDLDLDTFSLILNKSWDEFGFTSCNVVNTARVFYVANYLFDKDANKKALVPNFALMSRRPGIGASYLYNKQNFRRHKEQQITQVHFENRDIGLPDYFKNKIFDKSEKTDLYIKNIIRHKEKLIEYQKLNGKYDEQLYNSVLERYVKGDLADTDLADLALTMKDQINAEYCRQFYKRSKSNKL